MRPRTQRLLLLLGTLVFLDLALRLFVWVGLLPYTTYPTIGGRPTYLDDVNESFGVWHYPNATQRLRSADFDIVCRSNAYGAQDRERARRSDAPRRVVVLGDSYVEGYGVSREERFTERLEAMTGVEHLNFGTSGCFGSIQEWLLYRDLARHFDHSEVWVFMLPFNDYSDNDPADFPARRYRPYLTKTDAGFSVTYPVRFEDRGRVFYDWPQVIKNSIDNHWYLANLLRWTTHRIKERAGADPNAGPVAANRYDRFRQIDLDRLVYSYEQIIALAGPERSVVLFTIPSAEDVAWAQAHRYDFKLVAQLTALADRYPNVRYLDLLPCFLEHARTHGKTYADYTHRHDGHWSAYGHAVVAEFIQTALYGVPAVP